jgi:hypothetical protein
VAAGWGGLGLEQIAVMGRGGFALYGENAQPGVVAPSGLRFDNFVSGLFLDVPLTNVDLLLAFEPGSFGGVSTIYDGDTGEFGLLGLRNGATGANYRSGDPTEPEGALVSGGTVFRLFVDGTPPDGHYLNQEMIGHPSHFQGVGVQIQAAYTHRNTTWLAAAATNGNVYVRDWSLSANATLAAVGFDDTRVFECIPDPMDADYAFCAATSTAVDKLSIYRWNLGDTMTPLGDVDTGDQPIGLDLSNLGWGQLQIVVANSGDGTATYVNVDATTFEIDSQTFELPDCDAVSVAKLGAFDVFSCRPQNKLLYFPIRFML